VFQLNWKAAATVATGATALAGWLATPPVPARAPARDTAAPRAPATVSLEQEATRLAARVRATAVYQQPARNPFLFPVAAPPRREITTDPTRGAEGPLPAPAAPSFPFRLTGVATDAPAGALARTAVLSSDSLGLVLATAGQTVADRYRIERIEDDAVDVVDTHDGRAFRVTMGR
jgi:hypothetical protein